MADKETYHFQVGDVVRLKADTKNELGRGVIVDRFYGIDGETYHVRYYHFGTAIISTDVWFELETAETHTPEFIESKELLLLKSGEG